MNWRWFIFDYADSELPVTFNQRMRAAIRPFPTWRTTQALRFRRWFAVALTASPLTVWSVLHLGVFARPNQLDAALVRFVYLALVPITWIIMCAAYGWLCRREFFYHMRCEGHDICLDCGYWLRDLPDSTTNCPECGAEREAMPGRNES